MDFSLLGWPEDGPTLELDWRSFSYAGKFAMSGTGKAVATDDETVLGALAFSEDRTDPNRAGIRYVTVREDVRGRAIGARVTAFAVDRIRSRYAAVRIGANNPYSYEAFYKAGFGYTGERSGLAELMLEVPSERPPRRYQRGHARYLDRDLDDDLRGFAADRVDATPPPMVDVPAPDPDGEN
ncbi:MAG: GNAT family N-acetyltransferase [Halanaeroarchaeum sp.]